MWQSRACARGRVELTDVIAGLVHAQLRELGARADPRRPVLAGQHAGGAPHQRQVQRLHDPRRRRPRGPGRPGRESGRGQSRRDFHPGLVARGNLRLHDLEHPVEEIVGCDRVAQRLVAQDEAMPQHVAARSRTSSRPWRRPRRSASALAD